VKTQGRNTLAEGKHGGKIGAGDNQTAAANEPRFAEHTSYANAMALTAVAVFAFAMVMTALGRESTECGSERAELAR